MDERFGASIERGQVMSISVDGARIRSLSREGIVTPPLKAIEDRPLSVGDFVFYFVFEDGQGLIITTFVIGV